MSLNQKFSTLSRETQTRPEITMSNGQRDYELNQEPVRVLFSCTGVGIENRGIESFFRESFDALRSTPGIHAKLLKGAGPAKEGEIVARLFSRKGSVAAMLGQLTGRSAYAAEQWTSFPSAVLEIRRFRPDLVFYSDANLGFLLKRFRKLIGVPFKLLFSNGGPCHPPFNRHDFVQQVAPLYMEQAIEFGESSDKHFLVPYGFNIPPLEVASLNEKEDLRKQLGLPRSRPVVLSVGWIAKQHKRMDYVIREVANMAQPRPYLQLLGAIDAQSDEVIRLGEELLGSENFGAKSVSHEDVKNYYRAADLFVLGSLKEGFGRVYIEAMSHGLPVIGHDHSVIRYVLGDEGRIIDASKQGAMSKAIELELQQLRNSDRIRRRDYAYKRFSWDVLQGQYGDMFLNVAKHQIKI